MLKQIYLIRETGQCIFHQSLGKIEVNGTSEKVDSDIDPNLISGFFSAIISFANLATGKENEVNHLSLKNSNFYFIKRKHLHFILESGTFNPSFLEKDYFIVLNKIADYFVNYIHSNEIDDSISQISGIAELNEHVTQIISNHLRSKILGELSFINA